VPLWKRLGSMILGALLFGAGVAAIPRFGAAEQWLMVAAIPLGSDALPNLRLELAGASK